MYMKNYDNSINRFHSVKYNILHFSDILYPKFSLFLIIVYDYRPRIRDISCNNAAAMLGILFLVKDLVHAGRILREVSSRHFFFFNFVVYGHS
jgi:hypothetical protein